MSPQALFQQEEQRETARELADVLRLAHEMGQRLTRETHGELYDDVRQLNEHLRDVRHELDDIIGVLPH
jgi:hypothetical protein